MCGSPNIEPRPFEFVKSFPNPFELAPPDPLTASVCVAICVMVGKDGISVVLGSDSTVVDLVVVGPDADVEELISDAVDVGIGVTGCKVVEVGVPDIERVVEGADVKELKSDWASSPVLPMLSARLVGTIPPALVIAVSAADKIDAESKLSFVVPGGIIVFQSIVLN